MGDGESGGGNWGWLGGYDGSGKVYFGGGGGQGSGSSGNGYRMGDGESGGGNWGWLGGYDGGGKVYFGGGGGQGSGSSGNGYRMGDGESGGGNWGGMLGQGDGGKIYFGPGGHGGSNDGFTSWEDYGPIYMGAGGSGGGASGGPVMAGGGAPAGVGGQGGAAQPGIPRPSFGTVAVEGGTVTPEQFRDFMANGGQATQDAANRAWRRSRFGPSPDELINGLSDELNKWHKKSFDEKWRDLTGVAGRIRDSFLGRRRAVLPVLAKPWGLLPGLI